MNFFELLSKLKKSLKPLILYSLLNRIPLVVFSKLNEVFIRQILINLANVVYFRDIYFFKKDLFLKDELIKLINSEEIEDMSNRYTIIGYVNNFQELTDFKDFLSFIIGIKKVKEEKLEISPHQPYLELIIDVNSVNANLNGLNTKDLDLKFEENVLNKIDNETNKSLDDVSYLLKTQLEIYKIAQYNNLYVRTMDIEREREIIKYTILQNEIQKFISASEKIYMLLRKAHQFMEIDKNLDIKIKEKDLIDPIESNEASIKRILTFIETNWRNNFSKYVILK
ncbi:MAG TPA: hypothetical protein VGB37_15095 [Candidatus Lokiarchaeia archaeon]